MLAFARSDDSNSLTKELGEESAFGLPTLSALDDKRGLVVDAILFANLL